MIYFTNAANGEVKQIADFNIKLMNLYNGYIYYADGDNNDALTRINLEDLTQKQILSDDASELINVCGGWIRYHLKDADGYEEFCWTNIDSEEKKQL